MRSIVAVDFDGTLCESNYPFIGKANEGLISYLQYRKNTLNDILILWTCRNGELLDKAIDWCKSNGLIFDYVNENSKEAIDKFGGDTRKIYADIYIDDKNAWYSSRKKMLYRRSPYSSKEGDKEPL